MFRESSSTNPENRFIGQNAFSTKAKLLERPIAPAPIRLYFNPQIKVDLITNQILDLVASGVLPGRPLRRGRAVGDRRLRGGGS